jgi:hypothetical protein
MRALLLALGCLGLGACGVQAREARALQPSPLDALRTPDVAPVSVRLYIYQRDVALPRDYQLRSWAQFTLVARDRLRFHVGVARVEESEADTRGFEAWLEDEHGVRLAPEARELGRVNRIAITWREYPPTPGDPWCRAPPCLSRIFPGYQAYEGQADYVFAAPDLMGRERKQLTLVLARGGVEYRYTWRFGDGTEVQHYGRTHVDDEMGVIAVPGPYTELAGTINEGE